MISPHGDGSVEGARRALLAGLRADGRVVSRWASRRGFDSMMSLPLTIQQLKLLMLIVTEGPVTAHRVAEELALTPATVSGIVDRLVERDLVVRDHDATDRRVRPLRATPAGAEIVAGLTEMGTWHEQTVLSRLTTDDLRALAQGFRAVRRAVEEIEGAPGGEPGSPTSPGGAVPA